MWYTLLDNSRNLESIYGDKIPQLSSVILRNLKIEFGEDILCFLVIDSDSLPENPPRKWIEKEVNKVQLDFSFTRAQIHFFNSTNTHLPGTLYITFVDGLYEATFQIENENIFTIKSKWLELRSINGYFASGD